VGAYAKVDGDQIKIRAFVGSPDGLSIVGAQASGSIEDPEPLGDGVAAEILARGGRAILSDLLG
jgi:hydroxymethylbilane synthase